MGFPWQESTYEAQGRASIIHSIIIVLSVAIFLLISSASHSHAASHSKTRHKIKKTHILKTKIGKKVVKKKRSKKRTDSSVAQNKPAVPDSPPLMKVIPLDNGDYLLKPLRDNNSHHEPQENTQNKKPVSDSTTSDANSPSCSGSLHAGPSALEVINPGAARSINEDKARKESYYKRFYKLLISSAKQLLDVPYRYGGFSVIQGFDCSGFVKKVFARFGIELPRSSREQAQVGMLVTDEYDSSKFRIGDVLFFRRSPASGQIGHAGIYVGDGKMIHAARRDRQVTISSLETPYFRKTFVAAKRFMILSQPQSGNI